MSVDPNLILGAVAIAGVSDQIFEGIDGVLTSDQSRLLMIGNPTSTTGRFAEAFKSPGIAKITISAFDTPNFTTFGITEDDIATGAWAGWPARCCRTRCRSRRQPPSSRYSTRHTGTPLM